ncbi:chaperone modulator CbpM [Aurantibacillus circumpalustris]|uniref:chaperone modulator CbpM n=1 Tax=Aurantibacillus circumpalustris TaxID=3036359 RepID=UPI00295BD0B8|nr:chaperone modulator CbpM [Aurantibacillus circumpalustris]
MENEQLITLETVCSHYQIETSFIHSLNEYGLIEIITMNEIECINKDHLVEMERLLNLYYELNINLEGIDAIKHLLKRMEQMQQEIKSLRNRISED